MNSKAPSFRTKRIKEIQIQWTGQAQTQRWTIINPSRIATIEGACYGSLPNAAVHSWLDTANLQTKSQRQWYRTWWKQTKILKEEYCNPCATYKKWLLKNWNRSYFSILSTIDPCASPAHSNLWRKSSGLVFAGLFMEWAVKFPFKITIAMQPTTHARKKSHLVEVHLLASLSWLS